MSKGGVQLTDNTVAVRGAISQATLAALGEIGGEIQSETMRNCDQYVDTGKTKNSFDHNVTRVTDARAELSVGSSYMNAIYEEFGTGLYALNGDGRKTPWVYRDGKGNYHRTAGKRPRRMLYHAFQTLQSSAIDMLKKRFGKLSE